MNVRFSCPACDHAARADFDESVSWQCPVCDHRVAIAAVGDTLRACKICANPDLYRKKDFPHWLGMLLLVAACLAFLVTNYLYRPWLAWGILLVSALIDGLLYMAVGDVIVCYRCGANHRGFVSKPEHGAFEPSVGERYRQERLRRGELQANGRTRVERMR